MARRGHSSTRAALIYQHATRDRDKAIALALGDLVREVRTVQPDQAPEAANCSMIDSPCGTCVARSGVTNQPDLGRGGPAKALTWDFGLERAKGIEPS
jgi:hypothetical protein